jgi:anti-sigma regulatory factor (Ser/Thr protein kinase)
VTPDDDVMRIPADLNRLASVREFVRNQAQRRGADGEAMNDMVQAVDEWVTNTIVHGYRGSPGFIEIALELRDGSLVAQVRDEAPAFDPTTLPAPDMSLPLEKRPLHGLGIHLMRELTDSMSYKHSGAGNELTLTKRLVTGRGGNDAEYHGRA